MLLSTEERAAGWYRLTREILKLPDTPSVLTKEAKKDAKKDAKDEAKDALPPKSAKDKSKKTRRPQPLIRLVMRRYKSRAFLSISSDREIKSSFSVRSRVIKVEGFESLCKLYFF